MSYNPTQWKDGDLVTSAKLNKLEQGVAAGGIQIVHAVSSNGTPVLDKTWQEIYDGGFGVIVGEINGVIMYEQIMVVGPMGPSTYGVITLAPGQVGLSQYYYMTSSPDDYPVGSSEPSEDDEPSENSGPTVK